ncbi:uncharacterized protein PV09_08558 [Verruconis gallopava]|uniref:Carrier domain-containing protein n=1 Tax=Verruconis gallopava TaxID=253628 RepID=A0A0D1XC93_9PEZI|nr:uncharacterized protein PV09_08558 [Verruconis gallopava]KIV99895.1 hypothetical protein PV09_08558 [Verruconis gallopava]
MIETEVNEAVGPLAQTQVALVSAKRAHETPRSLSGLLFSLVESNPDAPLIGYPSSPSSASDYIFYTPAQVHRLAKKASTIFISRNIKAHTDPDVDKVVALLAPSNFDYIVAVFTLIRLRCTILLLSNRLATEAYLNLLDKTNCHDIIVSKSMSKIGEEIVRARPMNVVELPTRDECDLVPEAVDQLPPEPHSISERTAFIIHSSGSTGLPKPIFQSHRACLMNYTGGNGHRALVTLPLYHNHGLSTFFRAVCTCTPVALYNANLPLTASNLIQTLEAVRPGSFHGVPYALKLLAEDHRGTNLLAQCKLVMFGGSSCPDDIGDKLVSNGVYLVSHYGSTEMGQLMTSFRPEGDTAWNYVRPVENASRYLHFKPIEDNIFELVVLDGWKSKVASNSDNPPNSFYTSDLFTPHKTIPNAWKYVSRNDDRITLVNGEKVLPIPFENRLRKDPLIKEALLFGVGKALPGLFVIPSEKAVAMTKSQFLDAIWPTIAAANSKAEAFGQITREMVEILPSNVNYPATDKGTIIRAASYRQFSSLIQDVYRRFEGETFKPSGRKLQLDQKELEDFILAAFKDKTQKILAPDDDFFNAGIDSLQAITVQALIKREIDVGRSHIGANVIYEHPNTRALAAHLLFLRNGIEQKKEGEIEIMQKLITKYSHFEKHAPKTPRVVLLTGSTGSLGAHLLALLCRMENVTAIYCPVRASSTSVAMDRVLTTLSKKGLVPFQCSDKIVALPADLSKENLGLPASVLERLKESLTEVIHSAWAVNFNLGVSTFEQQHIKGVSNLIKLCLSVKRQNPARFYFCSSISVAAGTPLPAKIAEAPIPDLHHAQNMGYARSKLVAERIVQAAAESTGMIAKILRIGQIIGDIENGIWNATEAIPLMIRSAVTMGALPDLDETPNWLPVDLTARIILDITGLSGKTITERDLYDPRVVFHVQNPRSFHWTKDLLPALRSSGLQFEIVKQRDWVQKLRESNPDPVINPTIKLLDFFAEKYDNDRPGRRGLVFETQKTETMSPTIRGGYDVIGSGLIEKIVARWRAFDWA